jgi:hypothetical protein
MPYAVKPRRWIEKLIEAGVLRRELRHDADAVDRAIEEPRQRTSRLLKAE